MSLQERIDIVMLKSQSFMMSCFVSVHYQYILYATFISLLVTHCIKRHMKFIFRVNIGKTQDAITNTHLYASKMVHTYTARDLMNMVMPCILMF